MTIVAEYGHVVMDVANEVKTNVARTISRMLGMRGRGGQRRRRGRPHAGRDRLEGSHGARRRRVGRPRGPGEGR
ncbi:hypothetical protein [Streptosporangium vulgare]|uniref:hypothetical protein n=1 Tax=Streptosporangium vulgare TaxID=46190 RepID=UPI0031D5457C